MPIQFIGTYWQMCTLFDFKLVKQRVQKHGPNEGKMRHTSKKSFIQRQTCWAREMKSVPPCIECRKMRAVTRVRSVTRGRPVTVRTVKHGRSTQADHQCRFFDFRRLVSCCHFRFYTLSTLNLHHAASVCGFLSQWVQTWSMYLILSNFATANFVSFFS